MLLSLKNQVNAHIQKKKIQTIKISSVSFIFDVSQGLPFLISQRWEDLRAPKPRGHTTGSELGSRMAQRETQRYNTAGGKQRENEKVTFMVGKWEKSYLCNILQTEKIILYELFTFWYVYFKTWICASMWF